MSVPLIRVVPPDAADLRRRIEITPAKDPHTRIKPLALASGHGRYITVIPERELVSVGEWPLHTDVLGPPVPVLYVVIAHRTIAHLSIAVT